MVPLAGASRSPVEIEMALSTLMVLVLSAKRTAGLPLPSARRLSEPPLPLFEPSSTPSDSAPTVMLASWPVASRLTLPTFSWASRFCS